MTSDWINYSGYFSDYDSIQRSVPAEEIVEADYYYSYSLGESFVDSLPSPVLITFEADNGWLDVDGSYSSSFVPGNFQYLASSSTPYASFSPAALGATGNTTGVGSSFSGSHSDGTAQGTIEFIHNNSDSFDGNRVHFILENVGHDVSIDEPGLAKVNSSSNIDRGINITSGTDAVVGGDYNQFLEVLPSETQEGGLTVDFSGDIAGTGEPFANHVTAFGFYLMGREIKRDVYLDVYDTSGALIHSAPTMEPELGDQALVEYISFALDPSDTNKIAKFELRQEYNSDPAIERDIFSIDNLVLQFGDEYSSGFDGGGALNITGDGYGGDGGDLEFEEISTNKGQNTIWESGDGRVWFGTSESDRKAVKDNAVDDAYYLYEDWGYGYQKAHSLIAEGSTGDFWLVLEEKHSSSDPVEYAAVRINGTTARLDWEQSFRGDIKEVETFVGANLEDDNTEIGYSSSDLDLTWKPAEDEAIDGGASSWGPIWQASSISRTTLKACCSRSRTIGGGMFVWMRMMSMAAFLGRRFRRLGIMIQTQRRISTI